MPIDLICLAVLGYGFWHGFNRGIISTVFNIAAYLFGILLSFKMTPTMTNVLERLFNSDNPGMFVAAFVTNLVLIMFILRMAAKSMEGAFRAVYLGFFNQVAGGLIMGGLAVLLYSILLWFFVKAAIVNQATIDESRLYEPYLKELPNKAKVVAERLRPMAEDVWETSLNWMDRMDKYGTSNTEAKEKIYEIPENGENGIEDEPGASRRTDPDEDFGIEE